VSTLPANSDPRREPAHGLIASNNRTSGSLAFKPPGAAACVAPSNTPSQLGDLVERVAQSLARELEVFAQSQVLAAEAAVPFRGADRRRS